LLEDGGFDLEQYMASETRPKGKLLYICGCDLVNMLGAAKAEKLICQFDFVIYQGSNENETSQMADLILPAATFAEVDGTFTNFEGLVQRIRPAVEPLGESLPVWRILTRLATAVGIDYSYDSAEEVFQELAQTVVEFESLTYEKIGHQGSTLSPVAGVVGE
jgi:predicted molibdopterin-dependent oxidoreductase YjgC